MTEKLIKVGDGLFLRGVCDLPVNMLPILNLIFSSLITKTCLSDNFIVRNGSYSTTYATDEYCVRFTPSSTGVSFCNLVRNAYNNVNSTYSGSIIIAVCELEREVTMKSMGIVVVMERLNPLADQCGAESDVYDQLRELNAGYFHNDLKLNNIMVDKLGRIRLIDFDYIHPSKIIISVSSHESVDLDFGSFFASHSVLSDDISLFRTFYDYTTLSLSIDKTHPLYMKVLSRLTNIFSRISQTVLIPLFEWLSPTKRNQVPIEALVRCPNIEAVSVNIFDLRGNAFAHNLPDYESYPSLYKSNGVYWSS